MVGLDSPWKTEIFWGWNRRLRSFDSDTLSRREERKVMSLDITAGLSSSAIRRWRRKKRVCCNLEVEMMYLFDVDGDYNIFKLRGFFLLLLVCVTTDGVGVNCEMTKMSLGIWIMSNGVIGSTHVVWLLYDTKVGGFELDLWLLLIQKLKF